MRLATFPISLDDRPDLPVYVRIADAIGRDVARGRLRPGDALPGSRSLAVSLGVHRSTVVAAYAELAAQGWIETTPGGATRVAAPHTSALPLAPRVRPTRPTRPRRSLGQAGFDLRPLPFAVPRSPTVPRDALALWGGSPDPRLVPIEVVARAFRRAARRYGQQLLAYSPHAAGHPRLRAALASTISVARGLVADPEALVVTRGSQMALDLVARALITPGDVVAVEALGYLPAARAFQRAGARLVPVPIDARGLDVDALAALLARSPVRALHVTPHHQYPTTVGLSPARRVALLALARRHRFAIVEDDYDQEFHYDGRPILPLASADPGGNVIYVGTLAKILAPGLRIGFVVAPPAVVARLSDERILIDRQGDALLECAIADLFEDGEIARHVRRTRRIYHERRDALCDVLDRKFTGVLTYRKPAGGLALWATLAPGVDIDIDAYRARCQEKGVYFQSGRQFTLDGTYVPCLRLGYATLDAARLATATSRMLLCLRRIPRLVPVSGSRRRKDSIRGAGAPMGSLRQSVPTP
jgi:GntR family transcriptional regulator/MocR family aminotransferase